MKNHSIKILIVTAIVTLITGYSQAQDAIYGGVSLLTPISTPTIDNPAFGIDVGILSNKGPRYSLGVNVEGVYAQSSPRSVSMNLILQDEKIQSEMRLMNVNFLNSLNLTPASNVNVFIDVNLGFRLCNFITKHSGDIGSNSFEKDVYNKISGGVSGEVFAKLQIPISKGGKHGIFIKTGIVAGSSLTYIDDKTVEYSNSSYSDSGEKKSSASYWVTTIGYMFVRSKN